MILQIVAVIAIPCITLQCAVVLVRIYSHSMDETLHHHLMLVSCGASRQLVAVGYLLFGGGIAILWSGMRLNFVPVRCRYYNHILYPNQTR